MILISPFAKQLPDGRPNPKNYPHWKALVELIDDRIIQVGVSGEDQLVEDFRPNLSLKELSDLVLQCDTWISVDSFFQHFCWDLGKPGVVLWGQSDPNIFGHPENINLLKDRSFLRSNQFLTWDQTPYRYDCWVDPEEVIEYLR